MRFLRSIVSPIAYALLLIACCSTAFAQVPVAPIASDPDPITLTANGCIKNVARKTLQSGMFNIQIVDGNGNATSITDANNSDLILTSTDQEVVTSGAIPSVTIPNPANTSLNPYYLHISIVDSSTGKITNYPKVQVMLNDVAAAGRFTQFNFCKANVTLAMSPAPTSVTLVQGPPGASGLDCSLTSPPGQCLMNDPVVLSGDPAGGAASANQAATQNYVDTSQSINVSKYGCSVFAPDNLPCISTMLAHPSGKNYYVPPGTYNVSACSPIQEMASHFEIHGAAWAATTFNFTGPAISTAPTNTTGWWSNNASTIQTTVAPHVGDSVLAYQSIAGLVLVTGIQPGTAVTAVSGASAPFTVSISLPTTAAAGSSGSPVPIEFGWQCIFSIGADDTNWFTIRDLGFSYSNLPQAPTDARVDYPATAILFNTAGIDINGIHDFDMKHLYFASGSRGIATTKNTVGIEEVPVWGANFEDIVGAQGIAPGTWAASQPGAVIAGLQGATINFGVKAGKGGGSPRLAFKNIYNRQTSVEPQMTVQNTRVLTLNNLESNSGEDVIYDFDNDYDTHLDGAHNEFYIVKANDHAAFNISSSSIQSTNVDFQAHICPTGTACATSPANPEWQAFGYRGSVPGTISVDNVVLIPYSDSLGYCQTTGTWTAGQTTITLNTPSGANCTAGLAGITTGQYVTGQGILPNTVVIVSAGPTYALSLPPSYSGSSVTITFSTYTSYVASVGSGATGPGSHIGGATGFNAALLPGDSSNAHIASADNLFYSGSCYVSKLAGSTTSPASLYCPSVVSTGTGSTNGIPVNNVCSISVWYVGTGTFPASQYRELATCHDNGAGGLSGISIYSSDTSVRGAESFVKTFGCDKAGNCTSTGTMKDTVETETSLVSAKCIGTDSTGKHIVCSLPATGMLTLPGVATVSSSSAYFGMLSPTVPTAVTVNSAELTLSTIPLSCTIFPVISLCSGTSSSTCFASATLDGTHSTYAMSVTNATVPSGTSLRLFISTPATTCGTNAVTVGAIVSYQ